MSPASYRAAPPRVVVTPVYVMRRVRCTPLSPNVIVFTQGDRTAALRITSETPSKTPRLLNGGQLVRFAVLLTGKSATGNVNDQAERLGNCLVGLLTFDNAARS